MPDPKDFPEDFSSLLRSNVGALWGVEDDALVRSRIHLYQAAYYDLLPMLEGKVVPAPPAPPENEQEFIERVTEFLDKNRDRAYEAICIRMKYCERKKKLDEWTLSLPLIYAIAIYLFDWGAASGIPGALWITTTKMLDKFCDCSKVERPGVIRVR
jgi:hypothetical protein